MSARPDRALFHAATSLGFPRLPIRPAVFVIAGREAWERFTTNGTDEDLAAARIAVAACLDEKAFRRAASVTPPSGQAGGLTRPGVTPAARGCAFCGGSLAGRRRHVRYCGGRCRVAAFREREQAASGRPDLATLLANPAGAAIVTPIVRHEIE